MTLTAIGGNNSTGLVSSTGGNLLGDNAMTGDLTLVADSHSLADITIRTGGTLTFRPYTPSTSLGINGAAGDLQLGNAFLNLIDTGTVTPDRVVFGHTTAGVGLVSINPNWNLSGYNFPLEIYGGGIETGSINMGNNSLLMHARTGDITLNPGAVISSGAANNALILAADRDFINLSGSTALDTPNGRWMVYANHHQTSQINGLDHTKLYLQNFTLNPPASILTAGNLFLFRSTPFVPPPPSSTAPGVGIWLLNPEQSPNSVRPKEYWHHQNYYAQLNQAKTPHHSELFEMIENFTNADILIRGDEHKHITDKYSAERRQDEKEAEPILP